MFAAHRDTVIGIFHSDEQAQRAVQSLQRGRFTDDQIGVISPNPQRDKSQDDEPDETLAQEGAISAGAAGAGVGALWGLGIVAGALPGIGPAIAGGTLGVLLSSTAAGAAAAGLAGGLVGLGISEDEADFYQSEFKAGRTLVTVRPEGRHADAVATLAKCGAIDITAQPVDDDAEMEESGSAPSTRHSIELPIRAADIAVEDFTHAELPPNGGDVRMPVRGDEIRIGDHGDIIVHREKPAR